MMTLYFVSFVAYFEIVASLFVYIVMRYKSVFSSTSCHFPFGNHTKTDIFPHNNQITFSTVVQQTGASLYIQILLLPLHSLTTSRKWNKAEASFVIRQCEMFCPHSLTSESGQFISPCRRYEAYLVLIIKKNLRMSRIPKDITILFPISKLTLHKDLCIFLTLSSTP